MVCLQKMSSDLQMLFAAVTHLVEGLSLETLRTLKVEKSLICSIILLLLLFAQKIFIHRRNRRAATRQ
jgi:hypothetical protein